MKKKEGNFILNIAKILAMKVLHVNGTLFLCEIWSKICFFQNQTEESLQQKVVDLHEDKDNYESKSKVSSNFSRLVIEHNQW